jgi:hypothetical protein
MISQNTQNTKPVHAMTAMLQNHFPAVENPRLIHNSGNPKNAVTKNNTSNSTHHVSIAHRHAGEVPLVWLFMASIASNIPHSPSVDFRSAKGRFVLQID